MSEEHADPVAGLVSQPGQYERKTTTEKTELWLVLRQAVALAIIGDVMLSIVGAGLVIVGPQAVALVGGAVGMAVAMAGWWYKRLDGVIAVLIGSALAACGAALGNWLGPLLWQFVIASPKYALIPYALPWLAAGAAAYWRIMTEIFDPNYPAPRQAMARTTPLRPWTQETQDLGPEVPEWIAEPVIRDRQGRQEPVMIVHPGKRQVTNEAQTLMLDLRDFLRHGVVIGFSRRSWIKSGKPRLRLADTGNNVTRGYHEKLRGHLQRGGLLSNDGDSPTLLVSLDEALAAVRALPHPTGKGWEGQKVGDASLPPIPPTG